MESSNDNRFVVARGICRNFITSEGTLEVLKGVDLTIEKGEMIAVVGESGVGKSTLLHILGGLDKPTAGEIEIDGNSFLDMDEASKASFRNTNVGFVFQHHYLLEDFTALENVMIPALIQGKERDEAASAAEQLLDNIGLSDRRGHRPRQLSGGEQQRVAVARALVNNPGIVFADEPSGNLDIATGRKLHDMLNDLNEKYGTTFLIATHNHDLAGNCGRIAKLEKGRLNLAAESRE